MVIDFDFANFCSMYPQFQDMSEGALEGCWAVACAISRINTDNSIVSDENLRRLLLNMLTCHIATLQKRGDTGVVGMVSSASQGSVSTSFVTPPITDTNAWYMQTPCGWSYWQAMLPYRTGGVWFAGRNC